MANQPGENTETVSFTLPRALHIALQRKAKKSMANKSDIIRRALMNYLTPEEREAVERALGSLGDYPKLTIAKPASSDPAVIDAADKLQQLVLDSNLKKARKAKR
jgi:Ribbon-helix-helix protein, copG family